ncbi:MAG: alpha/beta hydrolase [Alphaproteobacteria bacterium]
MRKLAVIFIVVILFKLLMLILLGSYFIRSANRSVGEPPDFLQAELVDIEGIKGWFVRANMPTRKCIILMHGVRSDRRSMIKRAKFLKAKGYSSLLFDFQAHGETKGEFITFGYKEARNAEKVVSYTKALKECSRVGIIGQSLGGAASLLGKAPLSADALVLEAVYPDIEAALLIGWLDAWGLWVKYLFHS